MRSILLTVALVALSAASALAQCPGGVCPVPTGPRRPVAVRNAAPQSRVTVNRSVQVQSSRRGFVLFPRLRR